MKAHAYSLKMTDVVIGLSFRMNETLKKLHPAQAVFLGYFAYICMGSILLSLPISCTKYVSVLDNIFVATSAVSTTGLSPISIADDYTFWGQLVILILIQLGGIGYMTFGSFIILSGKKMLPQHRENISATVFSLPKNFLIHKFIKSVVIFTFLFESFGAIWLYFIFESAGMKMPLWSAVFHSISSFCTAGFGLYNDSFIAFHDNVQLNLAISILSFAGAIGFIVFVDIWRKLNGKVQQITLTSKIIIKTTFWLTVCGTFLIFISEPYIQHLPPGERLLVAFFQTMTALTTVGFNTISISELTKASLLLMVVLMVIGASPSGTGGGLKSTTFSAMIGIIKSALQGKSEVTFWGREVPQERVRMATASFGFYIIFLTVGIYLLSLTEQCAFESVVFEAASALGTVGLSMGITSTLTHLGKIIVTLLMFIGRLGPLTFGMALFLKEDTFCHEDNDIAI